MINGFSGVLAANYVPGSKLDLDNTVVQPKHDGVRVQITDWHKSATKTDTRLGRDVYTKTMTRGSLYVPNNFVRHLLDKLPTGLDGELIALGLSEADRALRGGELDFSRTMAAASCTTGEPLFLYVVYDYSTAECKDYSYSERMLLAQEAIHSVYGAYAWAQLVASCQPWSQESLDKMVASLVAEGYEGAILRRTDLPHKPGRSTRKHPAVLRIKSWTDCEATITAVVAETWHDCETNRRLRPKLIGQPKDFASSFQCEGLPGTEFEGQSFRAPLSVTDAVAKEYLARQNELVGKVCKVRYLAAGVVNKPRLPVCIGLREQFDVESASQQSNSNMITANYDRSRQSSK